MRIVHGDLWAMRQRWGEDLVVVPVNCGFNDRGAAIMGAGVAKQAADRHPGARAVWGEVCVEAKHRGVLPDVYIDWTRCLIYFPTKGRWEANPALSWQTPSRLPLVEKSTQQLAACASRLVRDAAVYLPLVGCGLGYLRREDVLPILERHLDDRFVLVELATQTWCNSYETTGAKRR